MYFASQASLTHKYPSLHTSERKMETYSIDGYKVAKGNIPRHINTQTKTYSSDICGRSFAQQRYMNSHSLIHTDKKSFWVRYLWWGFPRCVSQEKSSSKSHWWKTVSVFSLSKCIYTDSLKTHLRIHNGEKPVTCFHCPRAFIRSGSLESHTRRHHASGNTLRVRYLW